jgi:hypothetical protein
MAHFTFKTYALTAFLGASYLALPQAQAMGSKPPGGDPVDPVDPEEPISDRGFYEGPYVRATSANFDLSEIADVEIRPSCLRAAGIDLLVFDPGHDDTSSSRRSDAKVRGGDGKYVFLWPSVHEGNLNMATAWMAYELMLKSSKLSAVERDELATMIRFTRYPGESDFGQYEKALSYSSATQGKIDWTITNRKSRVNYMIQNHRPYDRSGRNNFSPVKKNVVSRSALISVHADSSSYFGDDTHTWPIVGKGVNLSQVSKSLRSFLIPGLSEGFTDYFSGERDDSNEERSLKRASLPFAAEDEILTRDHSDNLAMLSKDIGGNGMPKVLIEGFVMNSKAGNLAHLELTGSNAPKLSFQRDGRTVATYGAASLYQAYARSIVRGIAAAYGCD